MIRETLEKKGIKPNKDLDQHFLLSEKILKREVDEAEITSEDIVLEIGGGIGNLTEELSDRAKKVITVEKDHKLANFLRKKFVNYNVEVIEGDFIDKKEELQEFTKCVSNPPYQISSEIVEFLGKKNVLSVLILQKEFVDKLVAGPGSGNYGFFTVLTNFYFIPVFLEKVPKINFFPNPEVDSAMVKFFPRKTRFGIDDDESFLRTVRALFTTKRKKVRNSLVDSRHILKVSKEEIKNIRDEIPYSNKRVVNLSIKEIADIHIYLEKLL